MNDDRNEVEKAFSDLFLALSVSKPNDRSDRDRIYAILKTDLEKCFALYQVYGKEVAD